MVGYDDLDSFVQNNCSLSISTKQANSPN